MDNAASAGRMTLEQNERIADTVKREQSRLRRFIRRRVPDPRDAEDILQDVRITDLFRRRNPERLGEAASTTDEDEHLRLEEVLPSPDAGPDALYARRVLFDAIEAAVDEVPTAQREVFVAHELEGRSFKEMAEETGVSVNTLLSRKRYAVLHLREQLRDLYDELTSARDCT